MIRSLRIALAAFVLLAALAAIGCSKKEEYGSKAEDWKKSSPPPNYRGPGQPGGPDSKPTATTK